MSLSAPQNFAAYLAGKWTNLVATILGGSAAAYQIPALNASGTLDITMMPPGIGPEVITLLASEALTAGQYINLWNNTGVLNARKADGSTTGKEAHGFVLAAFASGATATVYRVGQNNQVTGQTPGEVWLSTTTPGATQATAPSGAGCTGQSLGMALTATNIDSKIGPAVALAS
jgi:hypothetical protein